MHETAKQYIEYGWAVFPCRGKIPTTPHGFKNAIKDEALVPSLFKSFKNIAIVTGKISNIFVVDVDVKNNKVGDKSLQELIMKYGDFPLTLIARTWSGGQHIFFRYPKDREIKCRIDIVKDIDIRGDDGYILAPPSTINNNNHKHAKSVSAGIHSYTWQIDPNEIMIADAPEWLLDLCENKHKSHDIDLSDNTSKIIKERHRTLVLMAVNMRRMGFNFNRIYSNLSDINKDRCKPPKPDKEIERIALDIAKYSETKQINEPLTDVWNSDLLYEKYGDDIKYCDTLGGWFLWDGTRWKKDDSYRIMKLAKRTVKQIFQMAETNNNKKLFAHAIRSESSSKLKSMIELLKSEDNITVSSDAFDNDLYYINCKNGTLDMIEHKMLDHDPNHYITKRIDLDYKSDALCPTWDKFLDTVFIADHEMIHYIQKAVGYSLSGCMREQCLFILYGIGQNGKSTFLKHLFKIFGDYAMNTPASTLIEKYNESIPNDVARLKGARFVTSIESGKYKKFAEAQIKQLTGDDPISARFLHKEYFDFFATFKIFFATNYKPKISGTDVGIWRRIRTIPFEKVFTADEIDINIDKKIETEYEGILAWAVDGFNKWYKEGLGSVDKIDAATEEYKEDSDILGQYIECNCNINPSCKVKSSFLIKDVQEWLKNNGYRHSNRTEILDYFKSKGYEKRRGDFGNVYWYGIGARSEGEHVDEKERPY